MRISGVGIGQPSSGQQFPSHDEFRQRNGAAAVHSFSLSAQVYSRHVSASVVKSMQDRKSKKGTVVDGGTGKADLFPQA